MQIEEGQKAILRHAWVGAHAENIHMLAAVEPQRGKLAVEQGADMPVPHAQPFHQREKLRTTALHCVEQMGLPHPAPAGEEFPLHCHSQAFGHLPGGKIILLHDAVDARRPHLIKSIPQASRRGFARVAVPAEGRAQKIANLEHIAALAVLQRQARHAGGFLAVPRNNGPQAKAVSFIPALLALQPVPRFFVRERVLIDALHFAVLQRVPHGGQILRRQFPQDQALGFQNHLCFHPLRPFPRARAAFY